MSIRVWKLGSLEHNLVPTDKDVDKLCDALIKAKSVGVAELVWGPDINVHETADGLVRVWTIGNKEYGITPSKAAASKLKKILKEIAGKDGVLDIVYEAMLDKVELIEVGR